MENKSHAFVLVAPGQFVFEALALKPLKSGEARVKMLAAALNHRDEWIRVGQYSGIKYPSILGSDGAGIVSEVADAALAHWVGKQVLLNPNVNWGPNPAAQGPDYSILGLPQEGTFQTMLTLPVHRLQPIPEHLNPETGSALPLAGLTAYRATLVQGEVRAGQQVLVTGIGGGVAQFAFQFAVAAGAAVSVTSGSETKRAQARKAGAAHVFDYRIPDWGKAAKKEMGGFDVVIDSTGGAQLNQCIEAIKPGGRIVFYGATAGNAPEVNLRRLFWAQARLQGSTMGNDAEFEAMLAFVAQHKLQPVIDSVRPFADILTAFDRMAAGGQTGKLVVRMD